MTLRLAPCPRCQHSVVFGERACRHCAQSFDYGPSAPDEPSAQAIAAALATIGLAVAPPAAAPSLLQTGRHEAVGAVDAPSLAGIERTHMAPVGAVRSAPSQELLRPVEVGDVITQPPEGLYHSDFMRAPFGVPTERLAVIEVSPSSQQPQRARKVVDSYPRVTCRCGEVHRLQRCPACGAAHHEAR